MNKTTEALKLGLETAEGIAAANWKTWEELATPEEFERWVKSLANHLAASIREALAEPVRKCDGLLCNDCGEYKQKYKDLPSLTEKDLCVCEPVKQEPVGENKAVRCFLMGYGANRGLTVGAMRKHMELCGYGEWPEMIKFEPETNHLTKAVAQFWIRFLFKRYDTYAAPVSEKRDWVELEPSQLCEIEERIGLPVDSHDFETIGNAYIAAFKEKNRCQH